MTDVLDDRLADLFERVAGAVDVDEDLERAIGSAALEPRRSRRRGRTWMAAVAAAVVAAGGTAAVVRFVDRDPETTVAEAPVDPGPLYVLPGDSMWVPTNGQSNQGVSVSPFSALVVGIRADDMFLDPVAVRASHEPPPGFDSETWNALSIEGGPAFISPEESPQVVVVQQRGDLWLTATTDDRVVSELFNAFEAVAIDPTGDLVLQSDDLAVIASYDIPRGSVGPSTYFELRGPADEYVVVETVSGDVPLLALAADRADHLEPITVNEDGAWHPWGIDVDGEWHAAMWELAPRQFVLISGHVPEDMLIALAEDLEVVEEATWEAATGAA